MIISEVIFFISLIYFNCSKYINSELLFCLERSEFNHILYSQDTSIKVKKNNLLNRLLTKSLNVDRLHGMQMSVFQYKMPHRHHYHNNCDHNFCKVFDIEKNSKFHNHCRQYKQATELSITFLSKVNYLPHNFVCHQYVQDCRLYGMQTSVFKYQIVHKRQFHNNFDRNFCKVSDIQKHFSITIVNNTNRQINCI